MALSWLEVLIAAAGCGAAGGFLGWFLGKSLGRNGAGPVVAGAPPARGLSAQDVDHRVRQAVLQAREEWLRAQAKRDQETAEQAREQSRRERALDDRDAAIGERDAALRRRERDLDGREEALTQERKDVARQQERGHRLVQDLTGQLAKVSGLTVEDARQTLLNTLRQEVRFEAAALVREAREEAQKRAEMEAGKIVALAIERTASEFTAERSVTSIPLPNDKVKGRIIGHEGKNIRAFEKATGVQLLVDEQPEAVVLSCFNPIRREVARLTLERLVRDGNIHPKRIEELVERSQRRVDEMMWRGAQEALRELEITGMHPELVRILGRLRFRTSYGQNVLMHSIEVAKLTSIMAAELRLDGALAKRAGLLHDIGKAIDFEREGTHPEIGVEVATRYQEDPIVINAIGSHHEDVEVTHPISVLVAAADAISGSRPGARRKSVVDYVKRIEELEGLANEMEGVEHSYAIQAGREIRVIARPDRVGDDQLSLLAAELAKKIQSRMEYPGRIKVTVIRETRATDTAQ
jgi:ribonuclease Y